MSTMEIPAYVDPAVLVPDQRVVCILDGAETILTVIRVEPALMCSRPDGSVVVVLAHTVVPVDGPAPGHTCEYTADGTDPTPEHPACGAPATVMHPRSHVDFDYEEWYCAAHADPAWLS